MRELADATRISSERTRHILDEILQMKKFAGCRSKKRHILEHYLNKGIIIKEK